MTFPLRPPKTNSNVSYRDLHPQTDLQRKTNKPKTNRVETQAQDKQAREKKKKREKRIHYTLGPLSVQAHITKRERFLHLHAHTALSAGSIALHLLADLDVDVEELADAAVEADGLALVQLAFAVVVGDAFLGAGLGETGDNLLADEKSEKTLQWYHGVGGALPVEHVGDHLDFGLCGSNLLCRGQLGGTAEEERHGDCCRWSGGSLKLCFLLVG